MMKRSLCMIQHSVMLLAQRHEIALAAAAAMMAMTMTVTMARSIAIAIAMRYPRVAVEAVASELHDEDNRSTTTNTTLTPRSTSFSSLLSDGRESGEQPQRASSRSRRKAAGEQQRIMLPQVPRNSHIESQSPIANRVACRPRSILSRWHRHYSRIERASYPLSTPLIQASGSSQSISYAYRLSCLCIHVLVLVDVRVGVVSLPIPTRAHSHSKIEYL